MTTSEIYVVETNDGEVLLGQLSFGPGTVSVMTGFAGRPAVLDEDDVDSIVPASVHPAVEGSVGQVPVQPQDEQD